MTITVGFLDEYDSAVLRAIRSVAPHWSRLEFAESASPEAQLRVLEASEAVIVGFAPLPRPMIEAAPALRLIQKAGVGVEKIDVEAARERGIAVARATGSNAIPVAEMTVMLMLALLRCLLVADRELRLGHWLRTQIRGTAGMLHGRTVGLVGMGRVGTEVARRLRTFGCRVLYSDIARAEASLEAELAMEYVDLDELIAQADIVSLHASSTPGEMPIIGAREFGLMRPGSFLVNTARASLVDEDALVVALASGKLRGAALDVFHDEPLPSDHALAAMQTAVLTPHVAASVYDNVGPVMEHCFRNIDGYFRSGRLPPVDVVFQP